MTSQWKFIVRFFAKLGLIVVLATAANAQDLDLGGGAAEEGQAAAEENAAAPPAQGDFFGFGQQGPQLTEQELQDLKTEIGQLIQEAKVAQEAGDLNTAILKYDEAVPKLVQIDEPQISFDTQFQRGKILREQGYTQEAIRAYTAATEFSASITDRDALRQNYIEMGQLYLETEQFNTAMAIFQGALTLPGESRNPELLFNLGFAQSEFALNQQYITDEDRLKQLQGAIQSYDRALDVDPNYAEALFERGSTHSVMGDREKAIEDLEKSVQLDPSNTEAVAQLGFASLSRALSEGARRNGQRAKIEADLNQSVQQLTNFLNLVPEDTEVDEEEDEDAIQRESVLLQRSAAYLAIGNETQGDKSFYYQSAISDAEQVIELQPDAPDGYYQKGLAHRMLGDFQSALDAFDETISISPANTEALLRRGIIHFRTGDYESAETDFKQAKLYSIGGINPPASFWQGLCHARQEDHRVATEEYSKAIRYQPLYTIAYFNRGLSYMKLGRFARARDDFSRVLSRERDNSQARQLRDQAVRMLTAR